jgi:cytidylate kinase
MPKITIAIDGYSSTGKSTIAKQLASWLDYIYVDTGAMYRTVALFAMRNGFVSEKNLDANGLIACLSEIAITFKKNQTSGIAEVYLNNENVEQQIRTLEVSNCVSPVAAISEVRKKLVHQQQLMGQGKGVVMDGRDIGTVVFPEAELKIFLDASAQTRAKRRYKELLDRGDRISYQDVLKNVIERDHIDATREDSPLRKAAGAIEINNSEINLEDQFHIILQLAKDRIAGRIIS